MAGGGVGEAMLIGAAVGATAGGAGAAIQGGDPLKGALMGGAMGAVGGGLGGAAGGAGGVASGTTSGTAAGTTGGATVGAGTGATAGAGTGGGFGLTAGSGAGAGTGSIYGGAGQGIANATQIGSSVSGAGTAGGYGLTASSGLPSTASGIYGAGAGAGTTAAGYGIAAPTTTASLGGGASGAAAGGAGGAGGATGTNIFGQTLGQPGVLTNTQLGMTAATTGLGGAMQAERDQFGTPPDEEYSGPLSKFRYDPNRFNASNPTYAPASVYRPTYAAEGGIMQAFQSGGPVERMSQMNTALNPQGGLYPQGMVDKTQYALPTQRPTSMEVLDAGAQRTFARGGVARFDSGGLGSAAMGLPSGGSNAGAQAMADQGIAALGQAGKKRMLTKEQMDAIGMQGMTKAGLQDVYGRMAEQGLAAGGHLGGYSDGGRMLKGPGDGMSDNIPATIAGKQPARLADGEFVIPADVVSHLGNGSTDAGAKQLYAMMNRVRKARTGNPKQGKQIKPAKYMAA